MAILLIAHSWYEFRKISKNLIHFKFNMYYAQHIILMSNTTINSTHNIQCHMIWAKYEHTLCRILASTPKSIFNKLLKLSINDFYNSIPKTQSCLVSHVSHITLESASRHAVWYSLDYLLISIHIMNSFSTLCLWWSNGKTRRALVQMIYLV